MVPPVQAGMWEAGWPQASVPDKNVQGNGPETTS
jgi:hypothetical protein